ncbi:hypothetical protein [Celeribacter halophilus]|uniref:hypothetical protein n=1 Tax=Celeribacter halophilus TaxID=576117 RepID=UPI003A8DC1C7
MKTPARVALNIMNTHDKEAITEGAADQPAEMSTARLTSGRGGSVCSRPATPVTDSAAKWVCASAVGTRAVLEQRDRPIALMCG